MSSLSTVLIVHNRQASKFVLVLSAVVFPPLAVFLVDGFSKETLLCALMTVFGLHVAGTAYAIYFLWPYLADNVPLADIGASSNAETVNGYTRLETNTTTTNHDEEALSQYKDLPPPYPANITDNTEGNTGEETLHTHPETPSFSGDHKIQLP